MDAFLELLSEERNEGNKQTKQNKTKQIKVTRIKPLFGFLTAF